MKVSPALAIPFLVASVSSPSLAEDVLRFNSDSSAPALTLRGQELKLGEVKTIFVAPLGSGDGAELIRQSIINRLVKSGIEVVDTAQAADAILTGIGHLYSGSSFQAIGSGLGTGSGVPYQSTYSSRFAANGGTVYSASLRVRLVSKSRQILWTSQGPSPSAARALGGFAKGLIFKSPVNTPDHAVACATDSTVKTLVRAIRADQAQNQIGYSNSSQSN